MDLEADTRFLDSRRRVDPGADTLVVGCRSLEDPEAEMRYQSRVDPRIDTQVDMGLVDCQSLVGREADMLALGCHYPGGQEADTLALDCQNRVGQGADTHSLDYQSPVDLAAETRVDTQALDLHYLVDQEVDTQVDHTQSLVDLAVGIGPAVDMRAVHSSADLRAGMEVAENLVVPKDHTWALVVYLVDLDNRM